MLQATMIRLSGGPQRHCLSLQVSDRNGTGSFFERIAKTYRREHWGSMLRSILLMWYDCARHLSDVELTVRLLFELLAPG